MTISRRGALTLAAGAAIAVPAGMYGKWALTDRTRADFGAADTGSGGLKWSNWSGIQRSSPQTIATPSDEADLAAVLRDGAGPIRPVGSGHSFSALVPSDAIIVDLAKFAGLISTDMAAKTARIGAGTRLRQGARQIAQDGLGLFNLPDIDRQTFAGSFATATHGTGAGLPAIHDHAIGMRLVTPNGDIRDISKATDPDLFAAAKVSLGSLGVITQYDLQLRDSYNLNRKIVVSPTAGIFDAAMEKFETHRHYEFFYVPNSPLSAEVITDEYDGEPFASDHEGDDNALLIALKALRDHMGWFPWLRQAAVNGFFPKGEIENLGGEYWRILTSSRATKFNEMEYHIPAEDGLKAAREVAALLDSDPNTFFPMEIRMTAEDDAWLSPFQDGPRMSIAVHAAHDESYEAFFKEIEPVFQKYGGRPHWGKLHSLRHDGLMALYPRLKDFADLQRELDPDGRMLNTHVRGVLQADL